MVISSGSGRPKSAGVSPSAAASAAASARLSVSEAMMRLEKYQAAAP